MTNIPSQEEYEKQELNRFQIEIGRVARLPLKEKEEAFREAMEMPIDIFIERFSWFLDGSYGFGSYVWRKNMEKENKPEQFIVNQCLKALMKLEWNLSDIYYAKWIQCYFCNRDHKDFNDKLLKEYNYKKQEEKENV